MPTNTTTPSAGDLSYETRTPTPGPTRSRRRAVIAALLSLIVFIISVAILYAQWWRNDNPNSLIIVQGNAALDEVLVTISPNDPTRQPIRRQLKEGEDHTLRFHVPQGRYHVTIAGPGLKTLKVDDLDLTPNEPSALDLTPYATGSPTR
jgi:hypothetical protein